VQELLEGGAIKNTIVGRLGEVNDKAVLGTSFGGGGLGGLIKKKQKGISAY